MYTPGKLIFFDPFYFKDGGCKRKYFLVLKAIDDHVVLATLPSSQIHLPTANLTLRHGCLEIQNIGVNCYIFEAYRPITKCGWSFELNTFCYGAWLDDYNVSILNANHPIEGVDYDVIGELTDKELEQIIECFENSASVKRKYKRMLSE